MGDGEWPKTNGIRANIYPINEFSNYIGYIKLSQAISMLRHFRRSVCNRICFDRVFGRSDIEILCMRANKCNSRRGHAHTSAHVFCIKIYCYRADRIPLRSGIQWNPKKSATLDRPSLFRYWKATKNWEKVFPLLVGGDIHSAKRSKEKMLLSLFGIAAGTGFLLTESKETNGEITRQRERERESQAAVENVCYKNSIFLITVLRSDGFQLPFNVCHDVFCYWIAPNGVNFPPVFPRCFPIFISINFSPFSTSSFGSCTEVVQCNFYSIGFITMPGEWMKNCA